MLQKLIALALVSIACISAFSSAEEQPADQKKMIGVWRGGYPTDTSPRFEIVITADKIIGKDIMNGRDLGEGSYTLDMAKKTIDAAMTSPHSRVYQGIFSLDGDSLKWASDNGSHKRPAALVHKPGQTWLMVLTRQKQ